MAARISRMRVLSLVLLSLLASGQEATTTLRATARIVYVQVVVRDGHGRVVHGLKQGDFTLKEDGKPQRIDLFEEHTATTKGPAPAAGRRGFSNLPEDGGDGSLNVVLLDLLDTAATDQVDAKRRMIAFLKAMPLGKKVALFVLTNQLHMVQGFSSDSDVLVKAAEGIKLQELNRVRPVSQKVTDYDVESYEDSQSTIATSGAALERSLQGEDFGNDKARLDGLADAFRELARAVNGYPGRKNLFWLAGQFTSSTSNSLKAIATGQLTAGLGPGGVGANPLSWIGDPRSGTANRAGYSTTTPLSERSDRAVADSQLAVYPISLTGVETDAIGADQNGIGTAGDKLQDTMSQMFHDRQESRSVMEHVAEETGGEAFYGNNDVSGMLRRGFEDSENFYTLAFQPVNHTWDGKYRKLNVSLSEGGSLSYRRGYYAMPEQPAANESKTFQDAMRLDAPASTMLGLRAVPGLAGGAAKGVMLQTTVDVGGIGFTTDAEGRRHAKLVVGLMAYPVGVADPKAVQIGGTLNLNLTEAQYRELVAQGLSVPQTMPLGSGRYLLRVGVMDHGSGRVGTLTVPVRMP